MTMIMFIGKVKKYQDPPWMKVTKIFLGKEKRTK
jgi:hypothetical protein